MEKALFDKLKASMESFNITPLEGEFIDQPAIWQGVALPVPCKTMGASIADKMLYLKELRQLPVGSVERNTMIVTYLTACCSSFCTVSYDSTKDSFPSVSWTDLESDMGWFDGFVHDMMHAHADWQSGTNEEILRGELTESK